MRIPVPVPDTQTTTVGRKGVEGGGVMMVAGGNGRLPARSQTPAPLYGPLSPATNTSLEPLPTSALPLIFPAVFFTLLVNISPPPHSLYEVV